MPFRIIEFGIDASYAQLVTDEDGVTKSYDTLEAAEQEANDCQDGLIVCSSLKGPAIFDKDCMIRFLLQNKLISETETQEKFEVFMEGYKLEHECR